MALHTFTPGAGDIMTSLGGAQNVTAVQWHITAIGALSKLIESTNPKHYLRVGWLGLGGDSGIGGLQYVNQFWHFNFEYEFHPLGATFNCQSFTTHILPGCAVTVILTY